MVKKLTVQQIYDRYDGHVSYVAEDGREYEMKIEPSAYSGLMVVGLRLYGTNNEFNTGLIARSCKTTKTDRMKPLKVVKKIKVSLFGRFLCAVGWHKLFYERKGLAHDSMRCVRCRKRFIDSMFGLFDADDDEDLQ